MKKAFFILLIFLLLANCSTPVTLIFPQPERGSNTYLISYSADGDKKYLEEKIRGIATKVCSGYVFIEEISYGIDKERLATDLVGRLEWVIKCP